MTLAACPNCSGFISGPDERWIVGRPQIVIGRASHKFLISGCCEFSGKSRRVFDTETEAADAWSAYRAAAAQRRATAGFPRLANTLTALFAKRITPSQAALL